MLVLDHKFTLILSASVLFHFQDILTMSLIAGFFICCLLGMWDAGTFFPFQLLLCVFKGELRLRKWF